MVARVFLALVLPAPMGAFAGVWLVWQMEDFLLANNWLDDARTNWQEIVWAAAGTGVAIGLGQTAVWLRARVRAGRTWPGGALDLVLVACAAAMLPCLWWPHEPLVTVVAATWAAGLGATIILAGRVAVAAPEARPRAARRAEPEGDEEGSEAEAGGTME